jgi:RND family efflux transporter MFP subunit
LIRRSLSKTLVAGLLLLSLGALAWLVYGRLSSPLGESSGRSADDQAVPVEVAPIERRPIEWRRTFTGTLEAHAEFVVAPKVGGRIEQVTVDLGDTVTRGQVVAELDNAEFVQAVEQARAGLAVAEANLAEARNLLKIARRELHRIDQLSARGVSSESQRDVAMADQLAKQAHVEVTKAEVAKAEAELETARIRLGYTQVTAGWRGGTEQRLVAERYLDEGETVSANAALLRIVELDPITAVVFVTERDYGRLKPGQSATLTTDAWPNETFDGRIHRIAPVFRESVRQARVELKVANPKLRLKPGMFIRATVLFQRVADSLVIPEQALTRRAQQEGVFVVAPDGRSVVWREVRTGIRQDGRIQVFGEGLQGRVVVLGQQLLDDGSAVIIAQGQDAAGPPTP